MAIEVCAGLGPADAEHKGKQEGKKYQTLLGVTGSRKNFYHGKYYSKSAKADISFSA